MGRWGDGVDVKRVSKEFRDKDAKPFVSPDRQNGLANLQMSLVGRLDRPIQAPGYAGELVRAAKQGVACRVGGVRRPNHSSKDPKPAACNSI